MKIKAILFDVLFPIFTYLLGIATVILGVFLMLGIKTEDNHRVKKKGYISIF